MMFLLDTNACIRILNGSSEKLNTRLRASSPTELCTCAVVKAELYFGARKSARVHANLTLLSTLFDPWISLPFDDLAAEHYGQVRADLARLGKLIGPNDLMIASIARAHDAVLVTHNGAEFSRVVGLRLEDWEA